MIIETPEGGTSIPLYDYICPKCGLAFEELVSRPDEKVPCPSCKSPRAGRKPSRFALKSGDRFRTASGSGCSGCSPGPGGCSGCSR